MTSGLALERHARDVGASFARVTISLDGATPAQYAAIRGVDALRQVEAGVARLKALAPHVPIVARCTLHALNYRDLGAIIRKARAMALNGISFLAADLSSDAFGRANRHAPDFLRLDARQCAEFRGIIECVLRNESEAFATGFVTNSPERLRRLPAYYAALNGTAPFPPVACNAPWASAVLEANGDVRPCFFHKVIGNVRLRPFDDILHDDLPAFRRDLDVRADATCQRCVCSLKVGMRNAPWR
jgi:MoaA/NifB/PqqE/SkfB family radical SAM enzyme